jgi:hypothetical protein
LGLGKEEERKEVTVARLPGQIAKEFEVQSGCATLGQLRDDGTKAESSLKKNKRNTFTWIARHFVGVLGVQA